MDADVPAAVAPGPATADSSQQADSLFIHRYDDDFMMYVFKVEMCRRVDKHDRGKCPYAHPGELARRRQPSLYQALPCPEARAKKICPRLENCNCSHSTFEFWLHPDRYKTFLCERGDQCKRPVCFFAHSLSELRELPKGLQRTDHVQRSSAASSSSAQPQWNLHAPSSSSQLTGSPLMQWTPGESDVQLPRDTGHFHSSSSSSVHYAPLQAVPGEAAVLTPTMRGPQGLPAQVPGSAAAAHAAVPVQPKAPHTSEGTLMQAPYAAGSSANQQQMPGHSSRPPSGTPLQLHYGYQQQQPGQLPDHLSAQQQMPAGMSSGPQGPPLPQQQPGQPQLFVAYQPVTAPSGPSSTAGMVVMRPSQRGSTVAVIPAGPSVWQGSTLAEFPSEAPSLEALCASMNQVAVPLSDAAGSQHLLQQLAAQQHMPQHQLHHLHQQQPPPPPPPHLQQVALLPHGRQQQVLVLGAPVGQTPQPQQQQHLPMLITAAAPLPQAGNQVGQVGQVAPHAVQQMPSGQALLPGPQVVVLMAPEDPAQVGWAAVQPGL